MSKSYKNDDDWLVRRYNKRLLKDCIDGFDVSGVLSPSTGKVILKARLDTDNRCPEHSISTYDDYCGLGAENREDLYPVLAGAYLLNE